MQAAKSMVAALSQPATWLLMIQYAMSFGVELVVFNMAEMVSAHGGGGSISSSTRR